MAAPRKKSPSRRKTPQTTALVTTAKTAAVDHGEGLVALVARRKGEIAEAFYDIGAALRELLHKKLYAALGFSSFEVMLRKRKLVSASTAYQLIEVVERFTREQALAVGPEKAYALSRYSVATAEADPPATLIETGVPGKKGTRLPVSDLSARDIEALTRKVKKKKKSHKTRRDTEAQAVEAQVAALAGQLATRGGGKVEATPKKRKNKTWWVVLELKLETLAKLAGG